MSTMTMILFAMTLLGLTRSADIPGDCCGGLQISFRSNDCFKNPDSDICRVLADKLKNVTSECNPCLLDPCLNGGTCSSTSSTSYTCACPPGFSGTNCRPARYNCTFDTDLCDWKQSDKDDFDFTRLSGSTPTNNTGPNSDHTSGSGSYIYTEATGKLPGLSYALLISPSVMMSPVCLTFYSHMYGSNMGSLGVIIRYDIEYVYPKATRKGNQDNSWIKNTVSINIEAPFEIIIQALVGKGGDQSDCAIDDISVVPGTCPAS